MLEIDADLFAAAPDISLDYAVMERAAAAGDVAVVRGTFDWSDIGSWSAVYDLLAKSPGENISAGAHVALVGDTTGPLFSEAFFAKLLDAESLDLRYRALGGERVVRFAPRGLRDELRHLSACRWPGLS